MGKDFGVKNSLSAVKLSRKKGVFSQAAQSFQQIEVENEGY